MLFFRYGTQETEYLKKQDDKLGAVIDRLGPLECEVTPDLFTALVFSIVSQQISSRAADTVWARLKNLTGGVTPVHLLNMDLKRIQSCGMTFRKAGYILGIAEAVMSGRLNLGELHVLSDQEVIARLSMLQGVGKWTAEMLLIFSLHRPDVVSYDDLAIRRAMMKLYGLETLPRELFQKHRKLYSPYGSVASLYLWELSVES